MKNIIYLIVAIIVLFSACTEPFDVDLDSSFERVVIQGSITNELKHHRVYLTKSADYFSNKEAPKVTGATVSISDGENTYTLNEVSDGIYETDSIAGEVGKTYTLNVLAEGKQYISSCFLNYCAPMDSIKFGYYDVSDFVDMEDTLLSVLMYAQEPPTPNNFYLWNVYRNDTLQTDTLYEKIVYDDEIVNGSYLSELEVQTVEAKTGDKVTLEILSVTKEYYDYFYQVMDVTVWNMGPMGSTPANPKGNIEEVEKNDNENDDPLGFFLAYSKDTISEIVPESSQWIELEWY